MKSEVLGLNYYINNICIFEENISFNVTKPGIYFLLGRNGAGKTTLVNTVTGLNRIGKTGAVLINDISIGNLNMINLRKNNIAMMLQSEIFPEVDLVTYLHAYAKINNLEDILKNEVLNKLFISPFFDIRDHLTKKSRLYLLERDKWYLCLWLYQKIEICIFLMSLLPISLRVLNPN